jgi:phage terminase large subunit GpA-like protein
MGDLLSPARLQRDAEAIARGAYLADHREIIRDALGLFRPSTKISTVECAEKHRKFRTTEGGALVPYDRMRTPYNIAAMDALDDPEVNLVVMVKPSRSGGTTVAENFLFKMLMFGPAGSVGWYLGSDDAVSAYVENVIKAMFDDHPELAAKIGADKGDDTQKRKRISGHLIEWLAAKDSNFRNREFLFGVMDEPDGWTKYSESPETQLTGRQKNVGRRRKGMILSHPDKGWRAGVAAAWESSSRGIFVMRCAECGDFAAAHATKYWPDVSEFKLWYQCDEIDLRTGRPVRGREQIPMDERIAMAARTAGIECPHCGVVLDDEQRFAMVDEAGENGWWMHRGQSLDPKAGIMGDRDPTNKLGFYVHGIMVKTSPAAELAAALEEALVKFERSGGSKIAGKALRELMSKQLAEIFEGKKDIAGVSSASLQKRGESAAVLPIGMFPPDADFITCAIDVAPRKFDVSFYAWDLAGRSWLLDRLTIRQREWADGRMRDIATRERIEDWEAALIDDVVLRSFPIVGREDLAMPVAQVLIDVGDGNVSWMGREFAARCYQQGLVWPVAWPRVQLLQGSRSAAADEVAKAPRHEDSKGRKFPAGVKEWSLGVHKLKELALERLSITDGGPGQCHFADGIARAYYDEFFNEPLVDGKFERVGPNESLDLFGYAEAARLLLKPDRADINWNDPDRRPVWALPVSPLPKGGDQVAAASEKPEDRPKSIFERFEALNQGIE